MQQDVPLGSRGDASASGAAGTWGDPFYAAGSGFIDSQNAALFHVINSGVGFGTVMEGNQIANCFRGLNKGLANGDVIVRKSYFRDVLDGLFFFLPTLNVLENCNKPALIYPGRNGTMFKTFNCKSVGGTIFGAWNSITNQRVSSTRDVALAQNRKAL